MRRLAALSAAFAVLISASAYAQRGPPFGVTGAVSPREGAPASAAPSPAPSAASVPVATAPAALAAAPPPPGDEQTPYRPALIGAIWTEPGGTFSFDKPREWKNVDTASVPGAPRLEVVAGNKQAECWFVRVPRPSTAALSPTALIATRAKPIGPELWGRIAINQQLLLGFVQVLDSSVTYQGIWPIQVATLQGRQGEVYGALHSRPGLDVFAFCTGKDKENRSALLNEVARSVSTPRDFQWERQPHVSLTAVP